MSGLVIGKSGQLSKCLQGVLKDAIYLDRNSLNLEDTESIGPVIASCAPKYVVNAAAYTAVDRAESEEETATTVNGIALKAIAETAKALDIPLIHVSTDYVFSGASEQPYVEGDAVGPINAYGRSKLLGERQILDAHLSEYWILRTSWVFSEFGQNFVKTILRLAAERDSLSVIDDQYGRPTYAGDIAMVIASILTRCADNRPIDSGIYHCASSGESSWFSFAKAIVSQGLKDGLIAQPAEIEPISAANFETDASRPTNSILNTDKLEQALGFSLPHWSVGLERTIGALTQLHK